MTSQRRDAWLALLLVMSAGYVDGYGLFAYGTFLSFMSGNTTLSGYNVGQGKFGAAMPSCVAIVGFVVGTSAGSFITQAAKHNARRAILAIVAALQLLVLLGAVSSSVAKPAGIAVMSIAMGILNRALTHIGGQHVNITFITGTLNQLGAYVARAVARLPIKGATDTGDTASYRAAELGAIWIAFLLGAIVAGVLASRLGAFALAPSIVVLVCLMLASQEQRV